jgi:hypothetical protein
MKTSRYATSRRKACLNCSTAKARCDGKSGRCTRCATRNLSCDYPQARPYESPTFEEDVAMAPFRGRPTGADTQSISDSSSANISSPAFEDNNQGDPRLNATALPSSTSERLDFSGLKLLCPINADDISNRWLNAFVPVPGQKPKDYPASITAFIYRIFNSYAAATVRGRGAPPFVHASQMRAASTMPPLSTCLTLVRICERPLPGAEGVAVDVLQREMSNLYEQRGTYNDTSLLAAFQAYLIYSMVLYFRLGQGSNPFLRQAMMNLQHLASASSKRGLVTVAEQRLSRPKWEAWIVAEANRRTLFAMYLFDSVLSTQDGLPSFLGTELEGLPAPGNQSLWRTQTRQKWETAYNLHLTDWMEGGLRIDELWPIPASFNELEVLERRRRVDQWLESVDEFGTMLYAVTSCTHGG